MILLFLSLTQLAFSAAQYEVPTSKELAPYAKFAVEDFSLGTDNYGRPVISYSTPVVLTGRKIKVTFSAAQDWSQTNFVLHSDHGELNCSVVEKHYTCSVKYYSLPIDPVGVQEEISKLNATPEEKNAIAQVAARFGGELQGILRF